MRMSALIVSSLKSLNFPPNLTRELRAAFVAQAVAFRIPLDIEDVQEAKLDLGKAANTLHGKFEPLFKKILNETNEFLPVDTQLAKATFARLLEARLEMIVGVRHTALLNSALTGEAVSEQLSDRMRGMMQYLATQPDFITVQSRVAAEPQFEDFMDQG